MVRTRLELPFHPQTASRIKVSARWHQMNVRICLWGPVTLDLTSSVPLDHRWSVDIDDITVTARNGEIVYCDIGWCISPAVAPLTLETQRLQLIFIMLMRLRSRVSAEAGPDDGVFEMYACVCRKYCYARMFCRVMRDGCGSSAACPCVGCLGASCSA